MNITLGERPVTLADVQAVAQARAQVAVAGSVMQRLAAAREIVERLSRGDDAIYGINSGLGANVGERVDAIELARLQHQVIRARAVAVGPAYDTASVRAMLFARVASLSVGGAGISPSVFESLVALLNAGVHPRVPRWGSIGVADLPQLAHVALALLGEGEAEFNGAMLAGADALRAAGLQPPVLGLKDGLSLVSANSASVGRAALVLHDTSVALDAWLHAVALSYEGFRANVDPIAARVVAARPAPGQEAVAARLRALLAASRLLQRGTARRLQDPLSLRCVPPVHGAAHWMLDEASAQVELELNSAGDSPLVIVADETMVSTSNFHVPALALAFDSLAIALAQCANLCVERCLRFMTPAFSGLPLQLTRQGPGQSGFATVQKTLTALANEIRLRANPASLDALPVSENVEDHAPMTLNAVEKLADIVERVRYLVATELVISAQAVDLRGLAPHELGEVTRVLHELIRAEVAPLDDDRPLGPDIDRVHRLVASGALGALRAARGR